MNADQVDYARALGDAKKREILSTMVGLRYADAPAFLTVTQIIAAYSFDATGGATLNLFRNPTGDNGIPAGTASYGNHPTFTFTPTTGEAYAAAYIRPLAPTMVLPLADNGVPIDLLLRITAQSIGDLQNGTMLGGPDSNGSPGFFQLLSALRRLQLAGALNVQYKEINHVGQVSLSLAAGSGSGAEAAAADIAQVRRLLGLSSQMTDYPIAYGQTGAGGSIPMVTRSALGILSDLGAEIEVPAADIASGATKPTVELVGGETRPTIVVHAGSRAPANAYVSIAYGPETYWIERTDFDSKYALTVVQDILALAESTDTTKAPIVTIPAN